MHIFLHIPATTIDDLALGVIMGNDTSSITQAISVLSQIQQLRKQNKFPKAVFWYSLAQQEALKKALSDIKEDTQVHKKALGTFASFIGLFHKVVSRAWESEQLHSAQYNYLSLEQTRTQLLTLPHTFAEATERENYHGKATTVILPLQALKSNYLHIIRCEAHASPPRLSTIPVIIGDEQIKVLSRDLLADNLADNMDYDEASGAHLADFQTILGDTTQFELTTISPVQGRKVYRQISSKKLFYVDNLHGTHLEVFDKTGKVHQGEGNITTGEIDTSKKDTKKKPIV